MRHITITLQLAVFDKSWITPDGIASTLVHYALDGLDAEIAFTSERSERTCPMPDPDLEPATSDEAPDPLDALDGWHQKAREFIDAHLFTLTVEDPHHRRFRQLLIEAHERLEELGDSDTHGARERSSLYNRITRALVAEADDAVQEQD